MPNTSSSASSSNSSSQKNPQTNQQKTTNYIPINCDMMDELEAFSTRHVSLRMRVRDDTGHELWIIGKIIDLFTREHAEFCKLTDGREFRLDQILEYSPYTD
jgi:Rho-binding antiterminator